MKWQDILKNELATIQDTIDVGDVIEEEGPCNRKLQAYVKLLHSKMSPQAEELKKYLEFFKGDLEEYGITFQLRQRSPRTYTFVIKQITDEYEPRRYVIPYMSGARYNPVPEPVACKLLEMIKKRQTDTIQMGDYELKVEVSNYGSEDFQAQIKTNEKTVFNIFVSIEKSMFFEFDMPDGLKDRLQKYLDSSEADWWI